MAAGQIEVDPAAFDAGADSCRWAGELARRGAERLGTASLPAGMFGDFTEAHDFHAVFEAIHSCSQENLLNHHSTLARLADKANVAARAFTDTDTETAGGIRAAGTAFE